MLLICAAPAMGRITAVAATGIDYLFVRLDPLQVDFGEQRQQLVDALRKPGNPVDHLLFFKIGHVMFPVGWLCVWPHGDGAEQSGRGSRGNNFKRRNEGYHEECLT